MTQEHIDRFSNLLRSLIVLRFLPDMFSSSCWSVYLHWLKTVAADRPGSCEVSLSSDVAYHKLIGKVELEEYVGVLGKVSKAAPASSVL